jgi:hypothetical protein
VSSPSRNKGSGAEREVATLIGCRRTPLSGSAGGNDLDTIGSALDGWGIEVKRRAKLPVLLTAAMAQAKAAARSSERPAVVMRADHGKWMFQCELTDLLAWLEEEFEDAI